MTAAGAVRLKDRAEDRAAPVPSPETPGERRADIHLARFLLRPADFTDAAHWQVLALPADVVANMNRTPPFRRSVNAALSELVVGLVDMDAAALAALRGTREGRLCAAMLVAPIGAVERVAGLVGAAVLSKRITQLLMAADRRAARAEMGDEAFDFAIGEAPLMCPDLAGLAPRISESETVPFSDSARRLLIAFVDQIAPVLARLISLRFRPLSPQAALPSFSSAQLTQVTRLIIRKEPAWLAFID